MFAVNVKAIQTSILLFVAGLVAVGCVNGGSVFGNGGFVAKGPQTEDKRTVDKFDKIDVGSAFEVDVRLGDTASVTLDAPKDLLPHLTTKVSDGTLKIGADTSFSINNAKLRAHIVVPSLSAVTISGAANMKIDGTVTGPEFSVDASGASVLECVAKVDKLKVEGSGAAKVSISDIAAKSLKANASGATTLTLTGTVDDSEVEASGASTIQSSGLKTKTAKVSASGGSKAAVKADDTLSAEADGGSTIHYSGSAKVTKDASGASTIEEGDE